MNLEQSIHNAMDLTRRLLAALELGDMDICADLLELRGVALKSFEQAHRQAPPAHRDMLAPLIRELQEEDRLLRAKTETTLEENHRQIRENMMVVTSGHRDAYGTQSGPSCLDRKA